MSGIQPGDVLVFAKIGDTHVRVDLIEAVNDQYVITLEGTPYQLGDTQDAATVLDDMQDKLQQLSQLRRGMQ